MKEKYNTELADMEGPWSWQWMCQKKVAEEQFRHIWKMPEEKHHLQRLTNSENENLDSKRALNKMS